MVEEKGLAKLVARDSNSITVEILGRVERYRVLKLYEFTSERKMMSIVVCNMDDMRFYVFSKGASDAISNCADPSSLNAAEFKDLNSATQFAQEGLRTLAFAYKAVSEGAIRDGSQEYL